MIDSAMAMELVEAAPDALVVVDVGGTVVWVNRRAEDMFGYGRSDLVGMPVDRLVPERMRSVHSDHRSRFHERPVTRPMGLSLPLLGCRKDGTEFPVEIGLSTFRQGSEHLVVAAVRDETERRLIEQQLTDEQDHKATLLESLGEGILEVETTGRVVDVNVRFCEMVDLPRGKIVGIGPPYPWWPPETADHLGEQWRTLLRASGGPYEGIERRGNGTRMFVEGNMRPVIGATGDAETLITVVRDVTARAEAEEALLAAHETIAVADDRERIAWNLHDNVIQQIFAVGLGLQSVSNRLDDDVAERIGEFVGQLDATIAEVRNTIFELSRSRRAIGLRQELLEVVQQEQVALGFEVDVSFTGPMDAVPADVATEAVPVLREALSNVVRHSFASSVSVAVVVQRDHLFALTVEDNGRGLDEVVKRGRGLDNMERRATALRGTFSAGAAARGGTCIVWSVPIER